MSQERVSVRKMRELLRLRYDLKLNQVQIARSCNLGQSTVFRYLKRFEESGLCWPLPESCSDRILEDVLFPRPSAKYPVHEHRSIFRHWTGSCRRTGTSACSCCGKNTGPANRTGISTAISATCTGSGRAHNRCRCGKNIELGKRCLWIGPGRLSRSMMPATAMLSNELRSLWRLLAPADSSRSETAFPERRLVKCRPKSHQLFQFRQHR